VRLRGKWDCNIKKYLTDIGSINADWIKPIQDRAQWWAFMDMVMLK
jgi:hypothetical protein